MKRVSAPSCVLAMLLVVGALRFEASAGETTRRRLARFGDDLAAVFTQYPTDRQKTVRDTAINQLNTAFTKEIAACPLPPEQRIEGVLDAYYQSLVEARNYLKADKSRSSLSLYISACGLVVKREAAVATDLRNKHYQQCFTWLLDTLAATQRALVAAVPEARAPAYSTVNAIFMDMLKYAVPDAGGDPIAQLDANLKTAKQRFPAGTPQSQAANQQLYQLAESAARAIQQRATKK